MKLGFDPAELQFPTWLTTQPWSHLLPRTVMPPGATVATITADVAARTGLLPTCEVAAGTTDSIAAFLAAGASQVTTAHKVSLKTVSTCTTL